MQATAAGFACLLRPGSGGLRRVPRRPRSGGDFIGSREAAQAGLGALARSQYRLLARLARQRQRAASRERTEQHGIDDGAALVRELLHVEEDRSLRKLARGIDHALTVEAA